MEFRSRRFRRSWAVRRAGAPAKSPALGHHPSCMVRRRSDRRCSGCHRPRVYNTTMEFDAVVVGSGPNGLAAAIELAREGCSVCVVEARDTIGGGARSAELTQPGFIHDVCSAIHPFALASPFFRTLPLAKHGLEWILPPASVAHPLDDGTAAMLEHSIERTGATLGRDARAYTSVF